MSDSAGFTYRPALDGIRAVAVIAVVVYHLNRDWLPGGYLGVDIFFVMSGYLITTLLILERRRTGTISLGGFWSRRARRLLPAFVVMTVAVAIVYPRSVPSLERIGLRSDLVASLAYVANWHFISAGQSYFEQFAGVSPVRHTWSLAIEEQFYLIWPIVAFFALRRGGVRAVAVVAGAGVLVSVALLATSFDAINPSAAYYGTGTRVHQLLIGVLLAVALTSLAQDRVRQLGRRLLPLGVLVIGASLVWLADSAWLYYHGGTVLIAVAVVVVIAGLEGGHPAAAAFSSRPLVAVGLVSYGLYLWHWPVIRLVAVNRGPTDRITTATLAVAVTVALTLASYFLLERPIRRRRSVFGSSVTPRRVLLSVPIVSALALGIVFVSVEDIGVPEWAGGVADPGVARSDDAAVGASGAVRADLPTVAVVGDSVMVSLLPGLRLLSGTLDLLPAAFSGCPVGEEPLYDVEGVESPFAPDCAAAVGPAHAAVVAAKPDVVLWHDLQSVLARRAQTGELLRPGSPAWTNDLHDQWRRKLDDFLATGADVFLILPPLRSTDALGECADSVTPDRCAEIQAQDQTIRDALSSFWTDVADVPGVHLIDLDDLLCPQGNPCPGKIEDLQIRIEGWDQTHFTDDGAAWLAPQLMERVWSTLDAT